MQYFEAVKMGEMVAQRAQALLSAYTGYAVAAMMVKETKEGWAPVGEENHYAVVNKDENFCVVVVCDGDGYVKALSNPIPCRVAESIASKMEKDGLKKFSGRLILPL
ncbi:MAG: hypothetical protein NZ581_00715 [Candidatus Caldarchaeum sp.]|nr:hypothetical protein [Candidatus Caldarchaeum sp.]MDW8434709.1 hypothetical protein [Candidatus Caldarchaeum sp.]